MEGSRTLLVTGGAGFIGSCLVRILLASGRYRVVNVDLLTYAGHEANLDAVLGDPRHRFVRMDVRDGEGLRDLFRDEDPDGVLHLAAESHVDRSIEGPANFLSTNVTGSFALLEATRAHFETLAPARRETFRYLQVSTDEVYGTLGETGVFTEETPYDPRSPYAASKAGADHLVRAWGHTYGLPVLVTTCTNNYGPRQFPEKLIPLAILRALRGEPIPLYGDGRNVRDWIHVDDHARGLVAVLERGTPGETYGIGARQERRNREVLESVCAALDELAPRADGGRHAEGITLVADRPGHDWRYATDPARVEEATGWKPAHTFESGLRETVRWYLENRAWVKAVTGGPAGD